MTSMKCGSVTVVMFEAVYLVREKWSVLEGLNVLASPIGNFFKLPFF